MVELKYSNRQLGALPIGEPFMYNGKYFVNDEGGIFYDEESGRDVFISEDTIVITVELIYRESVDE